MLTHPLLSEGTLRLSYAAMARIYFLRCLTFLALCWIQGIFGMPSFFMALDEEGIAVNRLERDVGDSLVLNCSLIRGTHPAVSIVWSIEGKKLNETGPSTWLSLNLQNLTKKDEGDYYCSGRDIEGQTGEWLVKLRMKSPPRFKNGFRFITPSPQVFYLGDIPMFRCFASGRPKPAIQWFLNDKLLKNGDMHHSILLFDRTDGVDLKILAIEKMHAGVLRCQASNSLGQISHNINVIVKKVSDDKPAVNLTVSPIIENPEARLLTCVTSTVPIRKTDVFWSLAADGPMLENSGRYLITRREEQVHGNSGIVRSVLRIRQLPPEDCVTFTCNVAYPLGIVSTTVTPDSQNACTVDVKGDYENSPAQRTRG